MHFEEFLQYTSKIVNVTLPSTKAHAKMMPSNRAELINAVDFSKTNPRNAAVMMLLYPKNSLTHMALILRTSYNGVHSSQIAFPGGKEEKEDINLEYTAVRETQEEIGVYPDDIKIIRPFTRVYIPPSNFMVYPFLGYSNRELDFALQEDEVAGLVELPITKFLDDSIIESKMMKTSYAESFEVPGFKIDEHFVWGATAMMMSELKETLKMVF